MFKSPNSELLNSEKLEPTAIEAMLELGRLASNLQQCISRSKTLDEWATKVVCLLPKNLENRDEFKQKFMEFVNEYRNKSEGNDGTDCS